MFNASAVHKHTYTFPVNLVTICKTSLPAEISFALQKD